MHYNRLLPISQGHPESSVATMTFGAQEKSQPLASHTSPKEKHLKPTKEHVSIPRYGPDSIHSWMTAGACFLTSFFGVAAIRASGFLYVAIVRHFNATRAEASWPIIVMSGVILLAGMGSGMVFVVTPTLINEHFIRYRGLAMGINFAGCCTASFVFPKVLEVLTDSYGFKGALLLFGAICLNSLAFSLFLRQPAWLRNRLEAEASAAVEKIPREAARPPKTSLTNGDVSATARCAPPTPGSFRHGLTVFSCPMFYVIMYSYICFTFAYECYISLLVDFSTDRGVSLSHAVTMISVSSIADLVGRLALPAAADRGSFTSRTLLTVTFFHLGALFLTLPLAWGYWWLFAFTSAIAFCIGTSVSVFSVLVAEHLGIARQSMAYGMVSAFTGITSLFKPFIVGYFRDSVGSYDSLFMICGSTVILAAIIWTVVHIKQNTRRSKECPLQ